MKILIVEAQSASRLTAARRLERQGSVAIMADCGYQGIEAFQREKPDLVLLDVQLPDIEGFEVARRMREQETAGNWTPIIFVSARSSDEEFAKAIAAGGDDYIAKPVSEMVLAAKIRAMQRIVQMRTSLLVLTRQLDTANRELKRLSASDALTALPNRRNFDETLEREWRRAKREGASISLMMCDVDHFKAYNDTYGHQAGDDCLKLVAATLARALERGGDMVARYGGEEFAVILPGTSSEGASFVAGKMLQAVRDSHIPHAGSPFRQVTLSIGVASSMAAEHSPLPLIKSADAALYQAKHLGRNQACIAAPGTRPADPGSRESS